MIGAQGLDTGPAGQSTPIPLPRSLAAAACRPGGKDDKLDWSVPVETLTQILLYHVAPGRRLAASVVESDRIRMAGGGFTRVSVTGAGAVINQAQIITTDVVASNGVIHVIDAVLLP